MAWLATGFPPKLKSSLVLTPGQQARQEMPANFDALLAWLATEEKIQAEAAKYRAFLIPGRSEAGTPPDRHPTTQGGLFVMMYTRARLPSEGKSDDVGELITKLKGDVGPEGITKQVVERERHTLARLLSLDALAALLAAMKVVATAAPSVKCAPL